MAHFAELDEDNVVLRVLVFSDTDIANNGAWLSTRNHSDSHIELYTYSSGQYITAYLYYKAQVYN